MKSLQKLPLYGNFKFHLESKMLLGISSVRLQNFPKNYHFLPPVRIGTCAYQGIRNISFLKNFAYVLNEWSVIEKEVHW